MAKNAKPDTEGATEHTGNAGGETPPPPAGAPAQATAPAEPLLLTPEEWAKRLGKVGRDPGLSVNKRARPAPFSWDHAAADQVHGWSEHTQHSADPLKISRDAYQGALAAAAKPDQSGEYRPHEPAISPYKRATR